MSVAVPGVGGQPLTNLCLRFSAEDKQRAPRALERSGERNESFVEQRVHECRVGVPRGLLFERTRLVPCRPVVHANDKWTSHQRRLARARYNTKLRANVTNHAYV